MREHNHVKTTLFSFFVGLVPGIVYLYFYINGYFGIPIFGWDFLGYFILYWVNPLALLSMGLVAIIFKATWKQPYHIENLNLKSFKNLCLVVTAILTIIMVYLFFSIIDLAKVLVFFYLALVGFFIAYYYGSKLFEIKNV